MSVDPIIAAAWAAKSLKPTAPPVIQNGALIDYPLYSAGPKAWTPSQVVVKVSGKRIEFKPLDSFIGLEAAHKRVATPLSVLLLETMKGKGYFTAARLAHLTGASTKVVVAQLSRYRRAGTELKKLRRSYGGKLQLLYSIP